jgi:[acyl-carrier-protein] S-malonyltransferase
MSRFRRIAFLFPGQGAQYTGMAKDFYEAFPIAKQTFQEADDVLGRHLSSIVFNGPDPLLTETKNSQLGIYVASLAILKTVSSLFPELSPSVCAGLSLGEYTALTAAQKLVFSDGLHLVGHRGQYMNDACETTQGTMAVVLGLDGEAVEQLVQEVNLPKDLWAANFNCPGQVVISGTLAGIEAGSAAAKAKGAKRVLPLQVHGAFHSGLMKLAEERLTPHIHHAPLKDTPCRIVMNVPGDAVSTSDEIRRHLISQVTHPVRWEQGMRRMAADGVDLFIEIGCGKTLAGFHKRIGITAPCISIEKVEELKALESALNGGFS